MVGIIYIYIYLLCIYNKYIERKKIKRPTSQSTSKSFLMVIKV